MAGTQLFLPAVGVQLAPEIVDLLRTLFAVGGLAHGAAAVHALHKPGQRMDHPGPVLSGPQRHQLLHRLERLPVNDGLMGALHPEPLLLRHRDEGLGFIADLLRPALHHDAGIHFIVEDAPDGGFVP